MATIILLTRAGCAMCARANDELVALTDELRGQDLQVDYQQVDVDLPGNNELRAEYGDLLPVILLDGSEHCYGEVDVARLRADVTA